MAKDTYERQMSAIIGKMLSDLELMSFMRDLKPLDFDKVRKRCINATWDGYLVGRKKGLAESNGNVDPT